MSYYHERDEDWLATPADAAREWARNVGHDNPDRQWILTPWDSLERNPWYCGPPQRHPDADYDYDDEGAA